MRAQNAYICAARIRAYAYIIVLMRNCERTPKSHTFAIIMQFNIIAKDFAFVKGFFAVFEDFLKIFPNFFKIFLAFFQKTLAFCFFVCYDIELYGRMRQRTLSGAVDQPNKF